MLLFTFSISLSTPVLAQTTADCEAKVLSLQAAYDEARRTATRLTSRADGQDLLALDLDTATRAALPSRPAAVAPPAGFDPKGRPDLDCTIPESGEAQQADLAAFTAALKSLETALGERQKMLDIALDAQDTPTAEAAPVPETTPIPEAATTPEALPEAAPDADATIVEPEAPAPDEPEVADGSEAAPGPDVAAAPEVAPMQDPKVPSLARRVIALPGARVRDTVDAQTDGMPLTTFSIHYVFDERTIDGIDYLRVGSGLATAPDGWVEAADTLPWSTMLVMQFAPRGVRNEVLFFEDETILSDLVDSPFHAENAADYYDRLRGERDRIAEDPSYIPTWDADLVAVEPGTAVTFADNPYILPILDHRQEYFDGDQETTLLRVAAVPAEAAEGGVPDRDTDSMAASAEVAVRGGGPLRVGIVFVMDTTASMQPFIERTYDTVEAFYGAFGDFESADFVDFGLVGFRDDIDAAPAGVDYVTRTFQPLDPEADPRLVLTNMRQMVAATVPTRGFREDGLAGVSAALNDTDWSPFNARIVVYVSDASVREGVDPLASERDLTAESVAEMARNAGVGIVPIHLLTEAGREADDIGRAEAQYRALAGASVDADGAYIAVEAADTTAFTELLDQAADRIVRDLFAANGGTVVSNEPLEPMPAGAAPAEPDAGARLAEAIGTEIFRAQLESLSDGAPRFLSGWAADRDLVDPGQSALEVSVFLTRNQLSTLDRQLDVIVDAYNAGGSSAEFFDRLQRIAAETATDPDAPPTSDGEAVRTLLPAFLSNLPYRSEVLELDRDFWDTLADTNRSEFIDRIRSKQRIYDDLFTQIDRWKDFGSDDPGNQATAMRLVNLP